MVSDAGFEEGFALEDAAAPGAAAAPEENALDVVLSGGKLDA